MLIAVGLSNPAGVVVGIQEVDVDAAGTVRLEGLEEPPRPSRLACAVLAGLVREPHGVDDDVVGHVATGVGGGVLVDSGDGATHVEHRRVRAGRAGGVGVIGDDGDCVVGEAGEARRLPVVVPPVEDGVVEAALEGDVRRGCEQVSERRPEPAEGPHRTLAVVHGTGVAAGDRDGRPPVQGLGDDRQWGDGAEPDDAAELVRRFGGEVPVEAQHVGGVVGRPEDGPGHHGRADGVEREPERGDDAEVAAAASERPEQIGVFVGGRPDDAALGGHHFGGQQVVDGEPVFAHEEADAAAEGEPGDAGVAHDAAGGRQTVGLRLVVDVAPESTTLHPGRATGGVDPHGPHRREVDDDPVVAHRGAGNVVAAAPYGDLQVVVAREAHGRDHIGHARAAGDAGRMTVDRAIPDPAGSVVAGAGRQQQLSAERSAELVERDRPLGRCLWCLDSAHLVLLAVFDERSTSRPGLPSSSFEPTGSSSRPTANPRLA